MARNFLHGPFFCREWQAFHSTVKVADFIARIDVKIRFVKRSQVCVLMKQRIFWILCDSGNLNIFVSFKRRYTYDSSAGFAVDAIACLQVRRPHVKPNYFIELFQNSKTIFERLSFHFAVLNSD